MKLRIGHFNLVIPWTFKLLHLVPDAFLITAATFLSLFLRLNYEQFLTEVQGLYLLVPLFVAIRLTVFIFLGVYRIIWRYISLQDALLLIKAILLSQVFIIAATYIFDTGGIPRSTFFISALLNIFFLCGIRFGRRLAYEHFSGMKFQGKGRRTIIYGAGTNGKNLLQRFQSDGSLGIRVIGFIDDDPRKKDCILNGIPVLGSGEETSKLLLDHQVQEVIIATQLPGDLLRKVVEAARQLNIRPQIMKFPSGISKGIEFSRHINLDDLLQRKHHEIDLSICRTLLKGRRVLITGAGGSIGSELARQILDFQPGQLLLLDHSEFTLYQIDHELRVSSSENQMIVPLLVDLKDFPTLEHVFRSHRPEFIFHAAAYKHVHLVESNPYSAILNNILGMRNLLTLSEKYGVDSFILISSDKAVNPAGLMGATKRICEFMVTQTGRATGRCYAAVRFGNVLGSSGSLIPMLKSQIERGLPLTITDKNMKRYFMLIPEAVSLVLKAATIARPMDIMVLRMGDPIKIVDIAKGLLALMGKSESEIPIIFTGVRPGEKMFEELYLTGAESSTEDPDILVIQEGDGLKMDADGLNESILELISAAQRSDPHALSLVKSLVHSEYYHNLLPSLAQVDHPIVRRVSRIGETARAETLN